MRIQATSPGKKIPIKERVSVLTLTAETVGEAIDLAAVLRFIEEEGLSKLADLAIERPFSSSGTAGTRR